MRLRFSLPAVALLALIACGPKAPSNSPPTTIRPVASIQEIMQSIVDPSADALWDAVSSTVTSAGIEDKQPRNDAEWIELRHLAIRLAEAANLLVTEGRPVAHAGRQLEDSHVKGILKPDEIQRAIQADPNAFAQHALALQQAAQLVLTSIDEKNVERFIEAGGKLDQACESCHTRYWYPNEKRPD